MSLGRALLHHSIESPVSPVTGAMRTRALSALKEAGWKGRAPAEQPSPASSSDEQLWAAMLKDDGKAFAELWRRLGPSLFGFSSRQLPPTDAEQITVEVLTNVYLQGSAWLDPRASRGRPVTVRERVFRTARGLVLRRQAQRIADEPESSEPQEQPAKDPDGPLRQLLGRETVEIIAKAASSACHVIEQEVVAMVADGRSADETASVLGLNESQARAVKHQALAKLRAELRAAKKRR